jgi:hypothetical protein
MLLGLCPPSDFYLKQRSADWILVSVLTQKAYSAGTATMVDAAELLSELRLSVSGVMATHDASIVSCSSFIVAGFCR